eukprot:9640294-Lingulodinium_polyedra.AAC.1
MSWVWVKSAERLGHVSQYLTWSQARPAFPTVPLANASALGEAVVPLFGYCIVSDSMHYVVGEACSCIPGKLPLHWHGSCWFMKNRPPMMFQARRCSPHSKVRARLVFHALPSQSRIFMHGVAGPFAAHLLLSSKARIRAAT